MIIFVTRRDFLLHDEITFYRKKFPATCHRKKIPVRGRNYYYRERNSVTGVNFLSKEEFCVKHKRFVSQEDMSC
jgi:hypothetical protein